MRIRLGLLVILFMLVAAGGIAWLGIDRGGRFAIAERVENALRLPFERTDIPAGATAPAQKARHVPAQRLAPLVVDLHSWMTAETQLSGQPEALVTAVRRAGWNYIRPALLGPNGNPDACCGERVIAAIEAAIRHARQNGPVLEDAIFVVGESGGGFSALCFLLGSTMPVRGVFAWAAITDLVAWHREQAGTRYAEGIERCTGSKDQLNVSEALRRSPAHMAIVRHGNYPVIRLYAGIHDGWRGATPITHSIDFFNRLASQWEPAKVISSPEILALLRRSAPGGAERPLASKQPVHFLREAGPMRLVIYEGAHEMLTAQVIADIREIAGTALPP